MKKKWWQDGVRFECQGSGQCCTSHGEFGYVFLNKEDRRRFATHFGLSLTEFTKKYCRKSGPDYHLIERPDNPDCIFLKGKRCSVYKARPTQCRTWPFWPEVMPAKAWRKDVADFCPGIGKGPLIPFEKIEAILAEQAKSELP
jgi:uncharacterized protein